MRNFDREKCRQNILNNRFDSITCVYHLCLKKYILEGNNSVSDLTSDLFEQFLKTDHLRINKANSKKENKVERSYRQVEIYKTKTQTSLRSNRSYINNDDISNKKNDKLKKNKSKKEIGKKSQKNLNYIPIIKSE